MLPIPIRIETTPMAIRFPTLPLAFVLSLGLAPAAVGNTAMRAPRPPASSTIFFHTGALSARSAPPAITSEPFA
ncbi:hypothetical protein ACCD01_19605, partial [Telluria sp. Tellsp99]